MVRKVKLNQTARRLVDEGATFFISTSGGKDSHAMGIVLEQLIPREQIQYIHADLGLIEWPGLQAHIRSIIHPHDVIIAEAVTEFFERVLMRRAWPSPSMRWCTSDLKRGPIEREIRAWLKANPDRPKKIVSCMGMRAQESAARKRRKVWQKSERNSKAGRTWYEWLPIHKFTVEEVFATIRQAGQEPHHAYGAGMNRLSCMICIMACDNDLTVSAKQNPKNYALYCAAEQYIDMAFRMPKGGQVLYLPQITGIEPDPQHYQTGLAWLQELDASLQATV